MELFNDGWEFSKQPLHTSLAEMKFRSGEFKPVGLPHDWAVYDTGNLYQDAAGWYRRSFFRQKNDGRLAMLRFEGVYMDSTVYVNGQKAGEWKYGYSSFVIDMTPYLEDGENEIMVSVNYQCPNSRWYSGAGIYRNVWLLLLPREHIIPDGIYFHASKGTGDLWEITVETEVAGTIGSLEYSLSEAGSGNFLPIKGTAVCSPAADGSKTVMHRFTAWISQPKLWDIEAPCRHILRVTLRVNGEVRQQEEVYIGFRSLKFSPEQGFLLNGRKVKLNGVCEHHDLGCLGAAYHGGAMRRRLILLKQMGVNAIRLAHNMAAGHVLEMADEMGLLIVSEAFDMWESPKTPYDYARFFKDWYKKDVASWIRRDRNHPSVILWSIGNEIYDTHVGEKGLWWTKTLMKEVKLHDPLANAGITIGSNYMPWENAQKCADAVKIAGYNYGEKYYDSHHREHPEWVIYGSETASTVQSRGIYHFPYQQSILADEDQQCSSLGNSATSWGAASSEACIIAERDHEFSCGQFLWTGFDYIGEPTPYHTRNSYFGQLDTAGFPKDSYFIYQAEWTDYKKSPMVHIFPYWDYNEDQLIDVRVCSNAPMVELFFNGKSQGGFDIDHAHGTQLLGHWQLPYKRGEICAIAYDSEGHELARETRHSFGEAEVICLKPDKRTLSGDGQDLMFLEISMADAEGYPVENANNRVTVRVEGAGRLAGLDNGDSTDLDGYKQYSRRLFSGKLLAVLKAEAGSGTMTVTVTASGLKPAVLDIPVRPAAIQPGSSPLAYLIGDEWPETEDNGIPVRNIYLESRNGLHLYEENTTSEVIAVLAPQNASDRRLTWSIVDDAGIPSSLAVLEPAENKVKVTAKSDGSFRLRCMSCSGTENIRIISQLEFIVTGLGRAYKDPYHLISAGRYDYSRGELGNGNEHGVATARDGESQVGFYEIDFGPYGSDEITLPVFALTDDPYRIRIYEGMPVESEALLIGDVIYQKPSIWNTYQEESYKLKKRLRGVTSICFVTEGKLHLKGFLFTRPNRARERQLAVWCNKLYGDNYRISGEWICEIGNNVTVEFNDMDFGSGGSFGITINGKTSLEKSSILLCFESGQGNERQMLEFSKDEQEKHFSLKPFYGTGTVTFVFLPGSQFDFHWFCFDKN